MKTQILRAGALIKYLGVPCILAEDVEIQSATDLANRQDNHINETCRSRWEQFLKDIEELQEGEEWKQDDDE